MAKLIATLVLSSIMLLTPTYLLFKIDLIHFKDQFGQVHFGAHFVALVINVDLFQINGAER